MKSTSHQTSLTILVAILGILTFCENFQSAVAAPEILNRAAATQQATTETTACQNGDPDDLEAIHACDLIVTNVDGTGSDPKVNCWVNRTIDAASTEKGPFYFCTTKANLNTLYCVPKGSKDQGPIGTTNQKARCDEKCSAIAFKSRAASSATFYCTYPGTRQKNHFICACTQ